MKISSHISLQTPPFCWRQSFNWTWRAAPLNREPSLLAEYHFCIYYFNLSGEFLGRALRPQRERRTRGLERLKKSFHWDNQGEMPHPEFCWEFSCFLALFLDPDVNLQHLSREQQKRGLGTSDLLQGQAATPKRAGSMLHVSGRVSSKWTRVRRRVGSKAANNNLHNASESLS